MEPIVNGFPLSISGKLQRAFIAFPPAVKYRPAKFLNVTHRLWTIEQLFE